MRHGGERVAQLRIVYRFDEEAAGKRHCRRRRQIGCRTETTGVAGCVKAVAGRSDIAAQADRGRDRAIDGRVMRRDRRCMDEVEGEQRQEQRRPHNVQNSCPRREHVGSAARRCDGAELTLRPPNWPRERDDACRLFPAVEVDTAGVPALNQTITGGARGWPMRPRGLSKPRPAATSYRTEAT